MVRVGLGIDGPYLCDSEFANYPVFDVPEDLWNRYQAAERLFLELEAEIEALVPKKKVGEKPLWKPDAKFLNELRELTNCAE